MTHESTHFIRQRPFRVWPLKNWDLQTKRSSSLSAADLVSFRFLLLPAPIILGQSHSGMECPCWFYILHAKGAACRDNNWEEIQFIQSVFPLASGLFFFLIPYVHHPDRCGGLIHAARFTLCGLGRGFLRHNRWFMKRREQQWPINVSYGCHTNPHTLVFLSFEDKIQ